jgi:flagellar biosynthesis chaperone FliJ
MRTQEQVDNLDLIINDPNSSANQVSAATAEKAKIIAKAKKRNQAFQKALKDQNLIP